MQTKAIKSKPDKIGGYDRYEVENAVSTMRRAAEIEADEKFLKVVVAEMNKEADRLEDSATLIKDRAKLFTTTQVKLDKVFKKNRKDQ